MRIRIDAGLLSEMVSTVSQAIESKPVRPEYECVYIEVDTQSGTPIMTAMCRGGGMAIKKVTDHIEAVEDGNALIPAKTLLAFIKLMNGEILMDVDANGKCTLKCGSKKTGIVGMIADDYPSDFSADNDWKLVKMDGEGFEKLVNSTLHCVSEDTGRMVLTGINFAFDPETGKCEATGLDGFRMAIASKNAETNDFINATIPATGAKLIAKIIKTGKDVSFRFGTGSVLVEDYDTAIEAPLLDGKYMDTKQIKVETGKAEVHINVGDMLDAVRLAMVTASDSAKGLIILRFEDDVLRISANSDRSEAVSSIACEINGDIDCAREIAFNGKYVDEALKASMEYAGEATLLLNAPASPMGIIPVGRDDYYQLALPVRRFSA